MSQSNAYLCIPCVHTASGSIMTHNRWVGWQHSSTNSTVHPGTAYDSYDSYSIYLSCCLTGTSLLQHVCLPTSCRSSSKSHMRALQT